jgi:uncharacterized membrane protein
MPGPYFGPGPGFGPGFYPGGLPLLHTLQWLELSTNLLWLALLSIIAWAAIRWFIQRQRAAESRQPMIEPNRLSALELLRRRYVLGEIDVMTFEVMLEHLVASETLALFPARLDALSSASLLDDERIA